MVSVGMNLQEIVKKNRSYRRFYGDRKLSREQLMEFIDIARLTPSGANSQKTRYLVFAEEEENKTIYPYLRWAGFYKDWDGPEPSERPTGYIVMLKPTGTNLDRDEGIKGQTILLLAAEAGLGGCFIGNIDKEGLTKAIQIPEGYEVSLIIALGVPKEEVVIDEVTKNADLKYYRDGAIQHVPKLSVEDVVLN